MKTTLARALKEKNRIAARLREAQLVVQRHNRKVKGSPRSVSVAEWVDCAERLSARLIAVKAAIARANEGILDAIVELQETKSMIAFFTRVQTRDDLEPMGDGSWTEYDVSLDETAVLAKTSALQSRANALQDRIDEYNARHMVELPAPEEPSAAPLG